MPKSNLSEGDLAPDFTVESTAGEFTLSKELEKGPILLLFYMGDFGTMCTRVLLRIKELFPEIEAQGLRLFAINTNKLQLHVRFRGKEEFPFHLLSDADSSVATAYGTVILDIDVWKGFSGRGVFIIDEERVIRTQWVPDNPAKAPDYEWMMEEVRKFAQSRDSSS